MCSIARRCLAGELLFSTSYDRTARCWDFHTGACIRIFRGHHHGLLPLLFLPANHDAEEENTFEEEMDIYTNDILITGSQDLTAKTWSLKTGDCLKTFDGHRGAVLCLATDAQGKVLFTGSGDNTIRVWDIHRACELRVYNLHQAPIINLHVRGHFVSLLDSTRLARVRSRSPTSCSTRSAPITPLGVGSSTSAIACGCTKDTTIPSPAYCSKTIWVGRPLAPFIRRALRAVVFTGCGDAIVRCFEGRTGVIKRAFKSHALAVNCIQVSADA